MKARSANSAEDESRATVMRETFGEYCRPFCYKEKGLSGGGKKEEGNEKVNKKSLKSKKPNRTECNCTVLSR